MGYTSLQAQYLTIPVYLVAGASFLSLAFISDRITMRSPFIIFANFIGVIGYAIILSPVPNGAKFFATFLCAIAAYTGKLAFRQPHAPGKENIADESCKGPGMNLTWLNVNVAPHYRRAAAIGFQQTLGNCAGIVAGQIYRTPPYTLGNAFSLGAIGVSQVVIVCKGLYIRRQTRTKDRIARGEIEDTRKVRTGDRELNFKYHL